MTGPSRTVVRRFLDLFDRAGPIFKSADIIDLLVTHILEDLPGERRTTAGSAIEDNGLFLIEILVVVWRVPGRREIPTFRVRRSQRQRSCRWR